MPPRRISRKQRLEARDDVVFIDRVLKVLVQGHRDGRDDKMALREIGRLSNVGAGVFPALYAGTRPANIRHMRKLATFFGVPIARFLVEEPDVDPRLCRGIPWRLRHDEMTVRATAAQLAALLAVRGEEPRAIHERVVGLYRARGLEPENGSEDWIRELVRSAMSLGLLYVYPEYDLDGILDAELSKALFEAFAREIPGCPIRDVTVVRNLTRGFHLDPVAPYLVARAAHDVIARFLARHPDAFMIGTAGGLHAALVASLIGAASSPFPGNGGVARRYTVVPLTCEPFVRHLYQLADASVGKWRDSGCALLGENRVDALTIRATGWRLGPGVLQLTPDAIMFVRDCYPRLHVAVYGCGDRSENGWIHAALLDNGIVLDGEAESDLCLNFIDSEGRPLTMRGGGERRDWLGIGLAELRHLARDAHKLALLLATGPHKGPAIRAVALARGANTLVLDQAAAEAALRELDARAGAARA
jgi:hypothetical protein